MRKWKKVVLVIKKENLLSEIPDTKDCVQAFFDYMNQLELDPLDFDARWLKSRDKEFKKTWHITIKFR